MTGSTMIPATLSGYTSWWNRSSSCASQSQVHAGGAGAPPAVGEEPRPGPPRQGGDEPVVEAEPRLVVHDVLLAVEQPRGLRLDGRDHARVRVTRVRDAAPGRVVQGPLAPGRDDRAPH